MQLHRYFRNSFVALSLIFAASACHAQAWSGVVSSSRAIDWSGAGVKGGIPSASWTQCGSTIAAYGSSGTPASPATIQSAINACGANQYVQLGSGTFYLNGAVDISQKSNVELRGMGANSTFLIFSGSTGGGGDTCGGYNATVCIEGDLLYPGYQPNGVVNWTAGYSQGTTVITLATVPNLKIGNTVVLDQLLDASDLGAVLEQDTTTGGNPFTSPGIAGPYASQNGACRNQGGGATSREMCHVYTVTGCNGSTTVGASCSGTSVAVTIDPPIEEPNWNSGLSPQAWWGTTPVRYAGIQNFSIDGASNPGNYGAMFMNCVNCWEQGIRDTNQPRAHTYALMSARITYRNNYLFLSRNAATTSYGLESYGMSDSLIENNITQAIASPFPMSAGNDGNVFGYNFSVNDYFAAAGYGLPSISCHASDDDFNLFEGNIGPSLDCDNNHGTHNFVTMFRNYAPGINQTCYSSGSTGSLANYLATTWSTCLYSLEAVQTYTGNRFFNIVGNVLGSTGNTTNYKNVNSTNNTSGYVFNLGVGDTTQGNTVPPDPATTTTTMLWGNCDPTNGGAGGTAFTTCQFNSSEVPTTGSLSTSQQPYANTVPGSHTLPASFYYSSKPSWWPSGKAWPLIGPDVTGGNVSGVNGLANTNPAQDCYNSLPSSTSNGTGGPFAFDATACYGSTPTASTPSCSPGTGTYTSTQSVSCSVAGGAPLICYNSTGYIAIGGAGSCPGGSTQYTTAISISSTQALYVWAGGTGYLDGSVVTYNYTITGGASPGSTISNGVRLSGGAVTR